MTKAICDIFSTPARILKAPVGTSAPADSVAAGGGWPAGWVEMGYTAAPLSVSYEFEEDERFIEQSLAPVDRVRTKEALTLETTLAELDLVQVGIAWAGLVTPTAAGVGQVGKEELDIGDDPVLPKYAWGFEGSYIDEDGATFPIRLFVWKATASAGGKLDFGKEKPGQTTLKVKALADMTKSAKYRLFKMQRVLEPAS